MFRLLAKAQLIRPKGLFFLIQSFFKLGINLMTVLHFSSKLYVNKKALKDDNDELSYTQLFLSANQLCLYLNSTYSIDGSHKIAILSRNSIPFILSICAISRLGASIFLINSDICTNQLQILCNKYEFDYLIYDNEFLNLAMNIENLKADRLSLDNICVNSSKYCTEKTTSSVLPPPKKAEIIFLTSGTTGTPKTAVHKPAFLNFLLPFLVVLFKIKLPKFKSILLSQPIYHGYGFASLFIGLFLGKSICISRKLDVVKIAKIIESQEIDLICLVPILLKRIMNADSNLCLKLKCIVSGGASLPPDLAHAVLQLKGPELFNLYGTSEAGFSILANSKDLAFAPNSIGKKILAVKLKLLNDKNQEVELYQLGRICIKSPWTVTKKNWIETGDLAFKDKKGYYFLCGRTDDMIVSGGENVYPIQVEEIIAWHPAVEQTLAIGIPDSEFGQRIGVYVVLKPEQREDEQSLHRWLDGKLARYQMPKWIKIQQNFSFTELGKLDRKKIIDIQ